jgi:hypothetical protein
VDFHGGGDYAAGQIFVLHTLISFVLTLIYLIYLICLIALIYKTPNQGHPVILPIMVKTALSFTSPLMEKFLFSEEEDFLEGFMLTFGGVIPTVRLLYDLFFRLYRPV